VHLYLEIVKFLKLLYPLTGQGNHFTADEIRANTIKFREQIIKMGPTFIKIGQILSVRYDLFHTVTCEELQVLLDHQQKAIDFKTVISTLKRELGNDFNQFEAISQEPIAVASLGQVHVGKLKKDGQKVAIKIQKPGLRERMKSDFKAIDFVIKAVKFTPFKKVAVNQGFSEFSSWTMKELDFTIEASNTERARETLAGESHTIIPKVYRNLTTNNILTTEYITGISAKELMNEISHSSDDDFIIRGHKFNKQKIVQTFDEAVFAQVFANGLIHGDPHPSNIILIDDDHVAFIDFGIMMQLNQYQSSLVNKVIYDICLGKREDVIKALIALDQKPGSLPEEQILKNFEPLFAKLETSMAEEYSPSRFIVDIVYNCGKAGIEVPDFWVLLSKVIVTYDGVLQIIKPQSNLIRELLPIFEKEESMKLFDLSFLKKNGLKLLTSAQSAMDLINAFPSESLELLREVRLNGIKVNYTNTNEVKPNKFINKTNILLVLIFASLVGFITTMFAAGPESPSSLIMLALVVIIVAVSLINLFKD